MTEPVCKFELAQGPTVEAVALNQVKRLWHRVLSDNSATGGKKQKKGAKEFDWSKASFGHFVLKIAYVGTKYHGLAFQDPAACPNCPTVESRLFEALVKAYLIKDRQSCNYSRCGRTDKGVHAAGNYIALNLRLKPKKGFQGDEGDYDYPTMLNARLPPDIRVLASAPAPPEFDARFSCKYRAYQYYFPLTGAINLDKMRIAAEHLVGEHDFRNFCKMDVENVTNYTRSIVSVNIKELPGGIGEFAVTGQAFLWHQVRCMMAILLMVASGAEDPCIVQKLLDIEKQPRKPVYEPADESGLVLYDCGFDGVPFAPGLPAPAAGETLAAVARSAAPVTNAIDSLRSMLAQARRLAAVHDCIFSAAGGDSAAALKPPRHTPLLRRAMAPSLDEKTSALELKRRRKESNDAGATAGDGGGD